MSCMLKGQKHLAKRKKAKRSLPNVLGWCNWSLYVASVSCLQAIVDSSTTWNRETASNAQSHLRSLTDFKLLIVTLIVTKTVLPYTKGLSVKLQGWYQDIIGVHNNNEGKTRLILHSKWFEEACVLASKWTCFAHYLGYLCQAHWANPPAISSEYYMQVITIHFLNHLVSVSVNTVKASYRFSLFFHPQ